MINLGNDYDSISTLHAGEFAKLPAGGYVCIVKNAVVNSNKNNKPMLVLDFDIAEGEFKGLFQNAQYPPKLYQNIEDQNGKTSPFLKGVLTDFEESNSGLHIKGGMFDERSLINKFIGVIFGIEEREYNDKIYSDAKIITAENVVDEVMRAHATHVQNQATIRKRREYYKLFQNYIILANTKTQTTKFKHLHRTQSLLCRCSL